MRVLFVNPIAKLGGAEQSLLDVLSALRRRSEVEPSLLILDDGPLRIRAERLGIHVVTEPLPRSLAELGEFGRGSLGSFAAGGADAVRYLARFAQHLRRARPDIVHTNGIKAHWLTCAVRRGPTVLHFRDFVSDRRLTRLVLRPLSAFGQRLAIANSAAVATDVRNAFPSLETLVIHNAVDTERLSPGGGDPALLAQLAGLPPPPADAVSVGLLATYARWKGHELFLQAAAKVKEALPGVPVRFYVIGGPIYQTSASQYARAELESRTDALGLRGSVGFVDFQDDVVPIYRALDIVVHASTRPEPFGRTIVEAMACGCAVVVTKEGGAAELFADGVHALGVEARSTDALTRAMARLVADPALRTLLARRARDHAVARFSRSRLADELLSAYRRVALREGGWS